MITFKIEKDWNKWHAYCPELPWCHTFWNTQKEALENLKDAIQLYLEDEIENQCINWLLGSKTLKSNKEPVCA